MGKESFEALIREWEGLGVVCRHDRQTDSWIFIAMHDDTLGRATGGTRLRVYPRPADGLVDAMRLAEGMTHKWAAIEMDAGGGKAVLALSRPLVGTERVGLLERYGALVESLRGSFATGEDLGTTPADMLVLARCTRWVHGFDAEQDAMHDPGPYTAIGVFAGIRTALRRVFESDVVNDRSVLIQGVGDVGGPLARLCHDAGARLILSDIDEARLGRVAAELSAETVVPDAVDTTPCDVFAPCAVGAVLNDASIPRLRCRIVAGSANNQLHRVEHARQLHERGILYAPDYVVNAGGALAFGLVGRGHAMDDALKQRVEGLGEILAAILDEAAERDESPLDAAQRRVRRTLSRRGLEA